MKKSAGVIEWLPVDSRLFGPFLSFGHIHGAARTFLVAELILSSLIVFGTLAMVVLSAFR